MSTQEQDPRERAFFHLTNDPNLSIRHLGTLIGVTKDTARRYKLEYLEQAGLTEVSASYAARQKQEQQAAKSITRAIGCSHMEDQATQQRLSSTLNHLHADWANETIWQQMEDIAGRLEKRGVMLDIAHYTGDSSYPTEYTITYGTIRASGPTYDLALTDFIGHLLEGRA
jgi:hypothetical protein